ncbi:MAG: hypothetical protein OEU95_06675, partial [Nitrospirota bacterium]|nr:hypothetical protein [Nitrospirota bacterium]
MELATTTPPISVRPGNMKFMTLKTGVKMAALLCKSCGAVALTVDPEKVKGSQSGSKKGQLFTFVFMLIIITMTAYLK